jgi:hypothetical protein
MARRPPRGFSFVTLLFLLAAAGVIYWIVAFGGAYWDNHELKSVMHQAGNMAYQEHDDLKIRRFIEQRMSDLFGYEVEEFGRRSHRLRIEYQPDDLIIERTNVPPSIRIRLNYTRSVTMPLIGGERSVYFPIDVEQDLSPVDWGKPSRL